MDKETEMDIFTAIVYLDHDKLLDFHSSPKIRRIYYPILAGGCILSSILLLSSIPR